MTFLAWMWSCLHLFSLKDEIEEGFIYIYIYWKVRDHKTCLCFN